MKVEFKPGHFKMLMALARQDGLTKEKLAKIVGNRNLAVAYRKDLIRWGLIYQDENDRFHLMARSWELLYVYQVFKLFEEVLTKAKGTIFVKEPGVIRLLEKGQEGVMPDLLDKILEGGLSRDDGLLFNELAMNLLAIHRDCLSLRESIMEMRRRLALLSFPEDKRELILRYREDLLEFLRLCYRIKFTKHPEYAEINKQFIEEMGKPSKRSEKKMFEEAAEVKARLVADELITDRNLLLEDLDLLFKESRKLASGREKTKLNQLYRRLHDRRRLDAYCEFLGRLTSLPREVYIVPVGFKGYLAKFIEIASAGVKMTGDRTFESWLKKAGEDINTWGKQIMSLLILRGLEKQRISDQIEEG